MKIDGESMFARYYVLRPLVNSLFLGLAGLKSKTHELTIMMSSIEKRMKASDELNIPLPVSNPNFLIRRKQAIDNSRNDSKKNLI